MAFVSCDGCAARGGGHSLSFPSLHPLLSPTVLHRGGVEEPSRHYCLFGVKVRPGRRCERKAVKNLPDPPRAAGKLHRGQIRCSAYAWVRSRESIVNAPAKQRWTGSEGTPRKARPIRGDGTTSGRVRNADMGSGGGAHPGRCSCGAHWPPAQKWANAAPPSVPSCLFSVCKSLNRTKRLCEACPAKGMPPFTRCRHCRLPLTAPPAPHESPWVRATTPLACGLKVLNSCKLDPGTSSRFSSFLYDSFHPSTNLTTFAAFTTEKSSRLQYLADFGGQVCGRASLLGGGRRGRSRERGNDRRRGSLACDQAPFVEAVTNSSSKFAA